MRQPAAFPKALSSVESMESTCERPLAVRRARPPALVRSSFARAIIRASAHAPARASGPS